MLLQDVWHLEKLAHSAREGERGAADAERDNRGFAVKFDTEEGNWDLVGNNTPVFFLRDPLKFPDLNRAIKRDPRTNLRSADANWDIRTALPEALHQVTIVTSDRSLPKSDRHMHGFGSHTFSFLNADAERFWVKFHFLTQQGIESWTLEVQVMPEADAATYHLDPFDLTKVWPKADYPLIEVGVLELNRNADNFFAEVEQLAFNPAQVVPGISFSPDKMLQSRLFSYGDAQRYRLGVNHHQIPVNAPRCPVHSYHRDGTMRVDANAGSAVGYEPNRHGQWQDQPDVREPPLATDGSADHSNHRADDDYGRGVAAALGRSTPPKDPA